TRFAVEDGRLGEERDLAGAARPLLGVATSFVGRDRELATLRGLVDEALSEPMAHVVLVTAPSGGGKSRLRHELLRRLEQSGTELEVWLGRGDPMRAGAPLAILADALRAPMGLSGGRPVERRPAKIRERIGRPLAGAQPWRVG